MNPAYLAQKLYKKIQNKILLKLYLKSGRTEALDSSLNETLLEEKWAFRSADCYKEGLHELEQEEMLDLSIVVPLYNSEKFIHSCVEGFIKQQTQYRFQILLVNDGSKDRTLEIAEGYRQKYPEKIVVLDQVNQGISAARNTGIKAAKGRYIGFADHDDLVTEDFVEKLMAAAYKEDADIVKAAFADIRNGRQMEPQEQIEAVIDGDMKENLFQYRSYIFPGIYKRELFAHVNFPVGFWYEDMIVRSLLYRQSHKFVHIHNVVYYKQFHEDNASFVVWDLKNYKCLEHLYLVMNLIEDNRKLGLPEDVWFYQCVLHEFSFILSLRVRKLDELTRKMVFLKACSVLNELYRPEYDAFILEDKKIWQRAFSKKEYKLWLLLSGHY